jgi:transcriptional antiterminator RfaH
LRKSLQVEVFLPRLRIERATRRGVVRIVEPLFPGYLFLRCVMDERLNEVKHTNGISSVVRFGDKIPCVDDSVIEGLQDCFEADEPMEIENRLAPGSEVSVANGAFAGMRAYVLRNMPARRRVQILLDVLGQPTPVEVARDSVALVDNTLANMAPVLARQEVCV